MIEDSLKRAVDRVVEEKLICSQMDHPPLFKAFTLPSLVLLMWFVMKVLPESFLQVSPLQRVGHCRCWLRLPQSHRRSHHRPIGPNPSHVTRSGMITLTGWIFKGPPRWMRVRACRAPRAQSTESSGGSVMPEHWAALHATIGGQARIQK